MGDLVLSEPDIDNVFKVDIFVDSTSLYPSGLAGGLEPSSEWQSEVSSGQSGVQ